MLKCPTGKRCYATQGLAEDALLEAHVTYSYPKGGGPVAVYLCDTCGAYHFTSAGQMNPRLADFLRSDAFRRRKLAAQWQGKWK